MTSDKVTAPAMEIGELRSEVERLKSDLETTEHGLRLAMLREAGLMLELDHLRKRLRKCSGAC
jgi:regulator of replication initiation timing